MGLRPNSAAANMLIALPDCASPQCYALMVTGLCDVSNLLLRRRPSHGEAPPQAGLLLGVAIPQERSPASPVGLCRASRFRSGGTSVTCRHTESRRRERGNIEAKDGREIGEPQTRGESRGSPVPWGGTSGAGEGRPRHTQYVRAFKRYSTSGRREEQDRDGTPGRVPGPLLGASIRRRAARNSLARVAGEFAIIMRQWSACSRHSFGLARMKGRRGRLDNVEKIEPDNDDKRYAHQPENYAAHVSLLIANCEGREAPAISRNFSGRH